MRVASRLQDRFHLLSILLFALFASTFFTACNAAPLALSSDVQTSHEPTSLNTLLPRARDRVPDDATRVKKIIEYLQEEVAAQRLNPKKIVFYSDSSVGRAMANRFVVSNPGYSYHDTMFGTRFKTAFRLGPGPLDSEINIATSIAQGKFASGNKRVFNAQKPADSSYWTQHELPEIQEKMDRFPDSNGPILHMRDYTTDPSDYVATEDSNDRITQRARSATPPNQHSSTSGSQPPAGSTHYGSGFYKTTDGRYWKGGMYYDKTGSNTMRQSPNQSPSGSPGPSSSSSNVQRRLLKISGFANLYYDEDRRQYFALSNGQYVATQYPGSVSRNCRRDGGCSTESPLKNSKRVEDPIAKLPKPASEEQWETESADAVDNFPQTDDGKKLAALAKANGNTTPEGAKPKKKGGLRKIAGKIMGKITGSNGSKEPKGPKGPEGPTGPQDPSGPSDPSSPGKKGPAKVPAPVGGKPPAV